MTGVTASAHELEGGYDATSTQIVADLLIQSVQKKTTLLNTQAGI